MTRTIRCLGVVVWLAASYDSPPRRRGMARRLDGRDSA